LRDKLVNFNVNKNDINQGARSRYLLLATMVGKARSMRSVKTARSMEPGKAEVFSVQSRKDAERKMKRIKKKLFSKIKFQITMYTCKASAFNSMDQASIL
jgi:hypothetical protein